MASAADFHLQPRPGAVLPQESNTWWWHPSRPGVRQGPAWFNVKLAEIDPDLKVTWNAYKERWHVWAPRPNFQHPICWGWILLFPVQLADGSYAPLDERTLAKIYECSAHVWGNARKYFQRIEDEITRDKERFQRSAADQTRQEAGDYWDFTQPKISMCGPSNGSKCSELYKG